MTSASEFARMAKALLGEPDVAETLSSICEFAVQALGCDHAGIHTVRNRLIETGGATDPVVEHADKLQMAYDEGPCLDAVWTHDTLLVHDIAVDERWPSFGPRAASLGLHGVLSIRLFTIRQTLGALNMYSEAVGAFGPDDIATAHILGKHASVALASARKEQGLSRAVGSRHLLGQAQGVLMERFSVSERQAFAVLRRYSHQHDMKLTDVAQQVINTQRDAGR
ncbi:MAG: GAF and ANTAR domain-containing protein [Propionibacteriales bacterium]|nr:GAF and ANTAR domain-containing protein [Propionibacteriales bacterium]